MRSFTLVTALWCASLGIAACNSRSDYFDGDDPNLDCRANPLDCEGDIGGDCDVTDDCFEGVCCRDKNCGGGMCAYRCDDDRDCPDNMLCEHEFCFFECDDDRDCGPGQSCEHGHTICEYEKHD